jgi:hypothetical protein
MEFALTLALPRDVRYAETARIIATEAAKEAGSTGAPAHAFADHVEAVARGYLAQPPAPSTRAAGSGEPASSHVTMKVHRESRAIVVTIQQQTMRFDV